MASASVSEILKNTQILEKNGGLITEKVMQENFSNKELPGDESNGKTDDPVETGLHPTQNLDLESLTVAIFFIKKNKR